ncbi:MAG: DNA polymerase III subunit beta, partial [Lachnospiraceae bacterium]|nr:DNA polymerase III subunit beta [Lachnospiraceae bacterium]
EDMEIVKEGADMIIGFNPKYLIDALRVIDDEDITFYLLNTKSPAIIRDDEGNYTYVVLPININVR